jgi:hypothetical protein
MGLWISWQPTHLLVWAVRKAGSSCLASLARRNDKVKRRASHLRCASRVTLPLASRVTLPLASRVTLSLASRVTLTVPLASLFRFANCNSQFFQLLLAYRRGRVDHQIYGAGCLGEWNYFAQAFGSGQDHHYTVEA